MFDSVGRNVDADAQRRRMVALFVVIGVMGAGVGAALLGSLLHEAPSDPIQVQLVPLEEAALEGPPELSAPAPLGGDAAPRERPIAAAAPRPAAKPGPRAVVAATSGPQGRGDGLPGPLSEPALGSGGSGSSEVRTFHYSEVTPKHRVMPDYPMAGHALDPPDQSCRTRLFIDEQGVPYDVVFEACNDVFHASAREALLKWRFEPQRVANTAIKAQFVVNVRYVSTE